MKWLLLLSSLALWLPVSDALADDDEFYKTKNCFACHKIDRNTVGPSFRSVAAKYAGASAAEAALAQKICLGSVGVWGQVPMPP